MPTAPVNDAGNELFFTDNGPVPGSDNYTTLVIYHGCAFNGQTFHKLTPLSHFHNIRLVIVNREDYAGSYKYTDAELDDFKNGRKVALDRLGLHVANFLVWFQKNHDIPKASTDRKMGGLVVMGWSSGTATTLALLGQPDAVSKETYAALEPYLRKLVIYDSPFVAFGYSEPEMPHTSLTDPPVSDPASAFATFPLWVSGYYNHPSIASRRLSGLDFSDFGSNPSFSRMSPEEISATFEVEAAGRTEGLMAFSMGHILREQANRALFDENLAKTVLPEVKVVFLLCERTRWICAWGFMENERLYNESVENGKKARPIRFVTVEGANHFVHWDEPETFIAVTVEAIQN